MRVLYPLHFAVHVTIGLLLVPEVIAMVVGRGSLVDDKKWAAIVIPIVAFASISAILIM
jgi:hypothetical protein